MKRLPALLTIAALCATVFVVSKDNPLDHAREACLGWPKDPPATIAACDKLLAVDLSDKARGEVLFYKALAYDLDKDHDTALGLYDTAAQLVPQKRSIYHNRARLHNMQKAWDKVLDNTNVLAKLKPEARDQNHFGGLWFSARALERTGQPVAAAAALDRYIEGLPDNVNARRTRALYIDRNIGAFDRIDALLIQLEDLSVAMRLDPDQHTDYERRTDVLAKLGLAGPAMRDAITGLDLIFAKVAQQASQQAVDQNELSQIRKAATDGITEVREGLKTALAADGTDWEGRNRRSVAFFMQGDIPAALSEAKAALALRPNDPASFDNVAFLEKVQAVTRRIGLEPLL